MNLRCRFLIWKRKRYWKRLHKQDIESRKQKFVANIVDSLALYEHIRINAYDMFKEDQEAFFYAVMELGLEKYVVRCEKDKKYQLVINQNE